MAFNEMENWHRLKTWPPYFNATMCGYKEFELRTNDRNFRIGDYLVLEEWDPETKHFSGRALTRRVDYILQGAFGLPENMCIMQLSKV